MDQKYKDWIFNNYPTPQSAINMCKEASEAMSQEFPELVVTNGLIQVGDEEKKRTHWWLKTKDGKVIDPTAHQYKIFGMAVLEYQEINDDHDLRKFSQGRCHNCGEPYFIGKDNWHDSTVCSSKCFKEYSDYLNND